MRQARRCAVDPPEHFVPAGRFNFCYTAAMSRKLLLEIAVVVGLTVLAAGFRFYDIGQYPAGLFPDEAANGEDALSILDGDIRPFYERGNGREALYYYLQAGLIRLFGVGVWQLHVASAIVGTLTVLATYFAVRPFFGRYAATLAMLFLATSHWHVTLSRTGFRAILIPLFVAAFTAFVGSLVVAVKKNKSGQAYVYAALAGIAFMGGFYTYIAYRVMVGVVIGIFGLMVLAALHPAIGFPHARRYGKYVLVAVATGLLTFAPLGWYFIQNPAAFVGRAGQVSVFNRELQEEYGGGTLTGTIWYSLRETLRSFFIPPGDLNWRHNVPGYALLNPLVGLLFLLGLAWALHGTFSVARKIISGQEVHLGMIYPYLLLLLLGMLMPVITTAEGIPHGLRSVGLILPIFMLAGAAGAVSFHWLRRKLSGSVRSLVLGVAIGLVMVASGFDALLYFVIARNDSGAAYAYRADLTEVAQYINEYAVTNTDAPRPYLVLDLFSLQTVHFLTTVSAHEHTERDDPHPDEAQHKWIQLDPASSHLTPVESGQQIIFTQSTFPDADRYEQFYGNSIELVESRRNRWNQEIMRVYQGKVADPAPGAAEFNLDA